MTRHAITVAALAASILLGGCSAGRQAQWETTTTTRAEGSAEQREAHLAEAQKQWELRDSAETVRKAIDAWEKAVELDPTDAKTLASLARGYYFLADGYLRDQKDEYLQNFEKGVAAAERSLAAGNPEFKRLVTEGAKVEKAIEMVGNESIEAAYWYAVNLGKWARAKGFATTVGNKDKIKGVMDKVLALDPSFFHAAPHRYFGAYFAVAPAFAGGDLEKSRTHFDKSLEMAPDYVGTKVIMAETLATKQQDRPLFDRLLAEVLQTDDGIIPGLEPETRVEKTKAKELQAKAGDLF